MARIVMNRGYDPLSGTYGYLTFRVINGKPFVRKKPEMVLPKNPTTEQKDKYKRQKVINECIARIQTRNPNVQESINQRLNIYKRVVRLYNRNSKTLKARSKLIKAILMDYFDTGNRR